MSDIVEMLQAWARSARSGGHETMAEDMDEAATEITRLRDANAALTRERDALREALQRIEQWGRAYPLSVFPEPDFGKAREALEAAGLTLDAVSASNMRHVVRGVSEIARAALKGSSHD